MAYRVLQRIKPRTFQLLFAAMLTLGIWCSAVPGSEQRTKGTRPHFTPMPRLRELHLIDSGFLPGSRDSSCHSISAIEAFTWSRTCSWHETSFQIVESSDHLQRSVRPLLLSRGWMIGITNLSNELGFQSYNGQEFARLLVAQRNAGSGDATHQSDLIVRVLEQMPFGEEGSFPIAVAEILAKSGDAAVVEITISVAYEG